VSTTATTIDQAKLDAFMARCVGDRGAVASAPLSAQAVEARP
jgi:hypothetical protein